MTREWAALALERGLRSAIVRVFSENSACAFYERLGARLLREMQWTLGGKSYPERWYGWRDLRDLTT